MVLSREQSRSYTKRIAQSCLFQIYDIHVHHSSPSALFASTVMGSSPSPCHPVLSHWILCPLHNPTHMTPLTICQLHPRLSLFLTEKTWLRWEVAAALAGPIVLYLSTRSSLATAVVLSVGSVCRYKRRLCSAALSKRQNWPRVGGDGSTLRSEHRLLPLYGPMEELRRKLLVWTVVNR